MRLHRSASMTVAAITAVLGLPSVAHAATPNTLIVDNDPAAHCSDSGSGTAAQPFCTISAAANVVQPGQTVRVLAGPNPYPEEVHLTRSGTPDQPITFLGSPLANQPILSPLGVNAKSFVLSGVHDIVIRGFESDYVPQDNIDVADSSRITIDRNTFTGTAVAGVRISGVSDHVTVSRNLFRQGAGVVVESGVHDSLVTANDFFHPNRTAIVATDAPNLAVTSNTVNSPCGRGVELDGASTGPVIENNLITTPSTSTTCATNDVQIALSAPSTTGAKLDYNLVHAAAARAAYNWGGTTYATAAELAIATGQGKNDNSADVVFQTRFSDMLTDAAVDAAAIDSADPSAPGVDTDLLGQQPVDDPNVPNTGPGGTFKDRGAYERSGMRGAAISLSGTQVPSPVGPAPFTVKATASAQNDWNTPPASYSFDFGDGSDPVVSTNGVATHTYANPGTYRVSVSVTDTLGGRATVSSYPYSTVQVNAPGDLTADFAQLGSDQSGEAWAAPSVTSPYAIADRKVDFGDGTVVDNGSGSNSFQHQYTAPGTYTVTLTATDESGRTATASKQLQVVFDAAHLWLLPGQKASLFTQVANTQYFAGANYTQGVWTGFGGFGVGGPDQSMAATTLPVGDVHTYTVANGEVYEVIHYSTGSWSSGMVVGGSSGGPALAGITQVSAATVNGLPHVVVLAQGRVYETTWDNSGQWRPWGDVTAAAGLPANATKIAAAGIGNSMHVAVLGSDGHLRIADGDWNSGTWGSGDLTGFIGSPANINSLAVASMGSKFHVLVVPGDGNVYQATADYSAGTWTSFANVSAVVGMNGSMQQIAAAATGNTLRLFGMTWDGQIYNANGDYTRGAWSSWADVTAPGAAGSLGGISLMAVAGS